LYLKKWTSPVESPIFREAYLPQKVNDKNLLRVIGGVYTAGPENAKKIIEPKWLTENLKDSRLQ